MLWGWMTDLDCVRNSRPNRVGGPPITSRPLLSTVAESTRDLAGHASSWDGWCIGDRSPLARSARANPKRPPEGVSWIARRPGGRMPVERRAGIGPGGAPAGHWKMAECSESAATAAAAAGSTRAAPRSQRRSPSLPLLKKKKTVFLCWPWATVFAARIAARVASRPRNPRSRHPQLGAAPGRCSAEALAAGEQLRTAGGRAEAPRGSKPA